MFIWTSGMHPGFALVFLVVGLVFVLYAFASAFRWTCGWDHDERLGGAPRRTIFSDSPPSDGWACAYKKCRAGNPSHARYCRMCGRQRVL
jgi:hypothetical protein